MNFARQAPVEIDHKIDGALGRPIDPAQEGLKPRSGVLGGAVDDEIGPQVLRVFERPSLRVLLDEEVERIVDRHVGDDVDLDLQFVDEFREDVAREPIAVWILLMVHEMVGGRDLQRVRYDAGTAVGRGPEPDDLRAERDRPVIFVVRQMMNGGSDRHGQRGLMKDRKTLS